ncbi:SUMO transferase [Aureococcus anophagefferens]|nr:SUMO transferase [Aureococcus anophagefferens]
MAAHADKYQRVAVSSAMTKIAAKSDSFYEDGNTLRATIVQFAKDINGLDLQDEAANGDFDDCDDDFLDVVSKALQAQIAAYGAPDVELDGQFKKMRKVDETQADQEADFKCPITTGLFVDPMISKTCGHTFSKKAAMSYFHKTIPKKCAVFGCAQLLTQADLKKDKEKEVALKSYQAKMKRAASQRDAVEMDDDDDEKEAACVANRSLRRPGALV